jgi:hypothetical protein
MLALGPAVTLQVDAPPQASEQDCPQLPTQSFLLAQARVQLLPAQPPEEKSQLVPDGQTQLVPVQVGAGAADWQPTRASSDNPARIRTIFRVLFIV